MILCNFISLWDFTVYMLNSCSLEFHFGQFDWSEICTEVSFTTPKAMWTLIMKLPWAKVKFYPEVKSQTGLSSLSVTCKHALTCFQVSGFFLCFFGCYECWLPCISCVMCHTRHEGQLKEQFLRKYFSVCPRNESDLGHTLSW